MTMRHLMLTLTAALALLAGCSGSSKKAQPRDWVIAAGPDTVYASEFSKRFLTSAVPGNGTASRVDFARSILLEHQLAREAKALQLDTSRVAKQLLAEMEDEALVESFLARKVRERIEISEEVMREQFFRMNRKLVFDAWAFRDSSDAFTAFDRILRGIDFEEASTADPTGARVFLHDQPLRYGQASPQFEEIAYTMKLDDISDPFYDRGFWWVLHLTHFEQERIPSEGAFASAAPTLRSTILRRMSGPEQRALIGEIMRGCNLHFDPAGFQHLVQFLTPSLTRTETPLGAAPELLVQERPGLLEVPGDPAWLDQPVLTFEGQEKWSWSVREAIARLAVMPQPLTLSGEETPEHLVRRALVYLVEFENLVEEAQQEGLLDDPEVIQERDLWQRHVLAVRARQYFAELAETTGKADTLRLWVQQLEEDNPERVRASRLREMELTGLPVLIAKSHFPLRLATPTPAGLDLVFGPQQRDSTQ